MVRADALLEQASPELSDESAGSRRAAEPAALLPGWVSACQNPETSHSQLPIVPDPDADG